MASYGFNCRASARMRATSRECCTTALRLGRNPAQSLLCAGCARRVHISMRLGLCLYQCGGNQEGILPLAFDLAQIGLLDPLTGFRLRAPANPPPSPGCGFLRTSTSSSATLRREPAAAGVASWRPGPSPDGLQVVEVGAADAGAVRDVDNSRGLLGCSLQKPQRIMQEWRSLHGWAALRASEHRF